MALKLFVHNTDTGECELAELAPYPVVTTSVVTQEVKGNLIATHVDGAGNTVEIHETITDMVVDGDSFVYIDEVGDKHPISICELLSALPDNGTVIGG